MFGSDIYDEETKGIIPRAAYDIFQVWDVNPDVKEVEIRCSMLEIYKENLRDLLTDDTSDLKIKESPLRGIRVEGLSEMPIVCEDDLMYWIETGEERRVWAETTHNAVSSRSHTIFMLEVRQTLGNDAESRGLLNLVDLAGSEKVGRSGAQGQIFEEGTKINLSLSALGNVIHALTSGLDHIPYRDSKLTRLLQESLGGNYKTSLVVTCSPHSSQLQETLTTLKFAQRAKKIKNRVKVNIKHSPDQLLKMIEQLKKELREKCAEIQRLTGKPQESRPHSPFKDSFSSDSPVHKVTQPPSRPRENSAVDSDVETSTLHRSRSSQRLQQQRNKDSFATAAKVDLVSPAETILSALASRSEALLSEATDAIEERRKQNVAENMSLKKRIVDLETRLETLTTDKLDLEKKLKEAEVQLLAEKKRVLVLEETVNRLELMAQESKLKTETRKRCEDSEQVQLQVYANQIKALTEALDDAESECFKLLKEKKDKLHKSVFDVCGLTLSEYFSADKLPNSVPSYRDHIVCGGLGRGSAERGVGAEERVYQSKSGKDS